MNIDLEFATQLARKTGELLLKYYYNPNTQTSLKPDKTVLTEADLAANRFINDSIRERYPKDRILSEEEDTIYPSHQTPTWVIDPLDGTSNFSLGVHYWGVSIARVTNGWPDIGALYFPIIDELYSAGKDAGAFLNEKKITTKEDQQLPISFFTCDSRLFRRYHVSVRYKARILGSAAYNFCAIARGVSIAGFESVPKIWDIAASWLVLREAGGVVHPFQPAPFPMVSNTDYKGLSYPILGARNEEVLSIVRSQIQAK